MFSRLKIWARRLSRDGHAIYLASRDPRVPWYVKFLAIVPLGIWLVVSLIPEQIMDEYRAIANETGQRPVSRAGMITIMVLWIFGALTLGWIGYALWSRPD